MFQQGFHPHLDVLNPFGRHFFFLEVDLLDAVSNFVKCLDCQSLVTICCEFLHELGDLLVADDMGDFIWSHFEVIVEVGDIC